MSKYECKKSHKMKLELSETIARNKINLDMGRKKSPLTSNKTVVHPDNKGA